MIGALLIGTAAMAQNRISAVLIDDSNGEPVGFATVSLTQDGAKKPAKYVLSDAEGKVEITGVRAGNYHFKAELLGYVNFEKEIKVPEVKDLGEIRMKLDREQLDAASVSAVGNPIIIKKDTIEYNASSFKTTDNDVLEDLLKKLPGVEVSEDGAITVNGQSIKKITIDGKTFFLDDPQLASKNIPAKIINKLKVIQKKSEQAEFTGIDDGEEEQVIDLSIKPGMMKGAFGNIMAGGGHDLKDAAQYASGKDWKNDGWRYQGAAFVGKFTDKTQLSLIANANNTNNRGFNDLSGSMMGGMRGGGMGGGPMGGGRGGNMGDNGITTSWMGGVNGAWTLFDGKMDLGGNYLYNNTSKLVEEESAKTTYLEDHNLLYNTEGVNDTKTWGHRVGMRLEHKFSENTSILFEPQLNFGGGNYTQGSSYVTDKQMLSDKSVANVNEGTSTNSGENRNLSTSGFFLLRQRLGIPGRTLTAMARYSFSNNDMDGYNISEDRQYCLMPFAAGHAAMTADNRYVTTDYPVAGLQLVPVQFFQEHLRPLFYDSRSPGSVLFQQRREQELASYDRRKCLVPDGEDTLPAGYVRHSQPYIEPDCACREGPGVRYRLHLEVLSPGYALVGNGRGRKHAHVLSRFVRTAQRLQAAPCSGQHRPDEHQLR